jgi:hypothetical protein
MNEIVFVTMAIVLIFLAYLITDQTRPYTPVRVSKQTTSVSTGFEPLQLTNVNRKGDAFYFPDLNSSAVWKASQNSMSACTLQLTLTLTNVQFDRIAIAVGAQNNALENSGGMIVITHNRQKGHYNIVLMGGKHKASTHVSDLDPITMTLQFKTDTFNNQNFLLTTGGKTIQTWGPNALGPYLVVSAQVHSGYMQLSNLSWSSLTLPWS